MSSPALEISGLNAWYGESHILHGVDLTVQKGEVVTLLGRNGAGRTTSLRAILGLTGSRTGSVKIHGTEAIDMPTYKIAHLGIGYCPEERGIFASLSCEENLLLPPPVGALGGGMSLSEIYEMFPNLLERRHSPGTRLSGGEQQMCAIGRAMMAKPEMILLDEPSMGLAPQIVEEVFEIVKDLNKRENVSFLLAEQNTMIALKYSDYGYILENGRVVMDGAAEDLRNNEDV